MKEDMRDGDTRAPSDPFDRIAQRYDESVASMNVFPYAGYERVLDEVVRQAEVGSGMAVLDLGIGTGNLAKRFSQVGCRIYGIDFSVEMLKEAQAKVPDAVLTRGNLIDEWPDFGTRFHRIVSSYALHHFEPATKIGLLRRAVSEFLVPDGFVVIADLAFATTSSRDKVRQAVGKMWEEEHYWIAAQALPTLRESGLETTYCQISSCAGVFKIKRAQPERAG